MDMAVERALLQRRFPGVDVGGYGKLLSDFFCARLIDTHSYEGRLFLMDTALLFVSTFSEARDYDWHTTCSAVQSVVAFHRGIIPTLDIEAEGDKETFTNIYNISGIAHALTKILPDDCITDNSARQTGPPRSFQRMVSVPARPTPSHPHHPPALPPPSSHPRALSPPHQPQLQVDAARPKAEPCPFFVRGGFCPRRLLCQLDHTPHTRPSKASPRTPNIKLDLSSNADRPAPERCLTSPTKRFCGLDEKGQLSADKGRDFLRSISYPATSMPFSSGATESHAGEEGGGGGGAERTAQPAVNGAQSRVPEEEDGRFAAVPSCDNTETESVREQNGRGSPSDVACKAGEQSLQGVVGGEGTAIAGTEEGAPLPKSLSRQDDSLQNPPQISAPSNHDASAPSPPPSPPRRTASLSLQSRPLPAPPPPPPPPLPTASVPSSFDFTEQLSQPLAPMDAASHRDNDLDSDTSPSSASPPVRAKGEGVFVFTGSGELQEEGPVRRKNAGTSFGELQGAGGLCAGGPPLPGVWSDGPPLRTMDGPPFIGAWHSTEEEEDIALLTQQLKLADSDSLHGDLDLQSQQQMLTLYAKSSAAAEGKPDSNSSSGSNDSDMDSDSSAPGTGDTGRHKRQPCMFYLSGCCRNGTSCPNYHGDEFNYMQSSGDEMEYPPVSLPPQLRVFSADSIGRDYINSGDKIILSPQILMACEQQELSYPMAFKLELASAGQLVYAGVLEFTSPEADCAYLPRWMMEHLRASEGDVVSFEHVDLPKGSFVRLQPVSSAWLGIPHDKRLAMMEFQLRNFQTLTEGSRVTLTYELNRYTLKVLQCKPAKGISILDTNITTDIVEPADFNRFHSIEEGQAEHTALDDPMQCSKIMSNTYRHFVLLSLPGSPLPSRLQVEVKQEAGDPDLFLSQACTAPTQSRYTWCCQDVGNVSITLSTDDKDYSVDKPLYAGVVSLCEETDYSISFRRLDTLAAAQARDLEVPSGQILRTGGSPHIPRKSLSPDTSLSSTNDDEVDASPDVVPPGQGRCSYCGSVMPSLRLLMHERHCQQSTFKCPLCQAHMPKTAEKKHHHIAHQLLTCDCGSEFTQLALHHHQEVDCTKRTVKCPFKWCNLFFPMDQLQHHESLCGRKNVLCPVCKEEVTQLELEVHMEAFHMVDTTTIDWTKPVAGQQLTFNKPAEPVWNFKCSCGNGFNFEDDLQVHQLTECILAGNQEDSSPPSDAPVIDEGDLVG